MTVFTAVVPGGTGLMGQSGFPSKVIGHVTAINDAVFDIFTEDLPGIYRGFEMIKLGWEIVQEAKEQFLEGPWQIPNAIPIVSQVVNAMLVMEWITRVFLIFMTGMLTIAAGIAMVIFWTLNLLFDIGRVVYHTLALGATVAVQAVKMGWAAAKALIASGPSSAIMSLVDPMKFGRAIAESLTGIDVVLVENDYVRCPGFLGKGIVRSTITVPVVGQLAAIKLNRNHAMVVIPSSQVSLLGHVYNSIRF